MLNKMNNHKQSVYVILLFYIEDLQHVYVDE